MQPWPKFLGRRGSHQHPQASLKRFWKFAIFISCKWSLLLAHCVNNPCTSYLIQMNYLTLKRRAILIQYIGIRGLLVGLLHENIIRIIFWISSIPSKIWKIAFFLKITCFQVLTIKDMDENRGLRISHAASIISGVAFWRKCDVKPADGTVF